MPLDECSDLPGLLSALALALEVGPQAGSVDALARQLADRTAPLLVLDGFERLVAHAGVVDRLRQGAPDARIVVTSRRPLGLAGETLLVVPPLGPAEAVELLVMRAAERGQPIAGEERLAELAERLDHLPLALELAVPWLGLLGADALAERLGTPLALPDPAEHGLRRMLARSWEALHPAEQLALTELSVFRGGFWPETAERVLTPPAEGRPVLVVLEALLRASLIQRTPHGGRVRLSLLAIVRGYASEQLAALGSEAQVRAVRAHAAALLDTWAQQSEPELGADLDNVVEAVRATTELGAHAQAVACLELLHRSVDDAAVPVLRQRSEALLADPTLPHDLRGVVLLLYARALRGAGELEEAEGAIRRALPSLDEGRYADALVLLGWLHTMRGQVDLAADAFAEARRIATDPGRQGKALLGEAQLASHDGDLPRATALLEQAYAALKRARKPIAAAAAQYDLAMVRLARGDRPGARSALAAAAEACRPSGGDRVPRRVEQIRTAMSLLDQDGEARIRDLRRLVELHRARGRRSELARDLWNLGYFLLREGRPEAEAREVLTEAARIADALGLPRLQANVANHLGQLLAREGRLEAAAAELERAIALFADQGERFRSIDALCHLALVRHQLGQTADAERALARASTLGDRLGLFPTSEIARQIEDTVRALQVPR